MSAATSHITLEMMLEEQRRIFKIMQDSYPAQVAANKLTPWERNHRFACHRKLIELLEQAIEKRKLDTTHFSNLLHATL